MAVFFKFLEAPHVPLRAPAAATQFALVRNAVAVAVITGTGGDIALVRDFVRLAVGFAFVRDTVGVAVSAAADTGQRNDQARRGRDRKSRPDGSRTDAGFRRSEELVGEAVALEL